MSIKALKAADCFVFYALPEDMGVIMTKKRNRFIVIVSFFFLLIAPTTSGKTMSQDIVQSAQELDARYEEVGDSWERFNIDELLDIYGPTSAGQPSKTATDEAPYDEIGEYGVEYENIYEEYWDVPDVTPEDIKDVDQ